MCEVKESKIKVRTNYIFGFNGKELDKETSSTTTYDYGFRIYSPALGRFLSVDPLTASYPMLTPYQFASNTPIWAIDLDGLEAYIATETMGTGHAFLVVKTADELVVYTYGRYGSVDWNQTSGEGVLMRLSGADAVDYINTEMTRMGAQFFEVGDVSADKLKGIVDAVYNAGAASAVDGVEGKVIDDYSLFSSNCSTHSCDWLQDAGTGVFKESVLGVDYNEDFVIPSSLQKYLKAEDNDPNKKLANANDAMKQIVIDETAKQKLQGAGKTAGSSGSSGKSSGSSANSSSSGSSTGRWTGSSSSSGGSSGGSLGSSSSGPVGSSSGSSSGASSSNSSGSSSSRRKGR